MEKRLIVAMLLSFAVIYAYSYLFPAPKPASPAGEGGAAATGQVTAAPQSPQPPVPAAAPVAPATAARDVVVESDLYRAVFSTQGGTLRQLVLKKYRETAAADARPVTLVNAPGGDAPLQTAVAGQYDDRQLLYGVDREQVTIPANGTETLVFSARLPSGAVVEKRFRLSGNSYLFQMETVLRNGTAQAVAGPLVVRVADTLPTAKKDVQGDELTAPVNVGGKVTFHTPSDIQKEARTAEGDILWSGFGSKYFVNALVSEGKSIGSVRLESAGGRVQRTIASPAFTLQPGEARTIAYKVYFGPKDIDQLKGTGVGLEEAIDLGWFSMIAKPLLLSLKFFHRYVGNFGLAIIIITVILKIFFYPLTHSSYKSMKEMQKLQPRMTELREKHKDDRDAMNRAIMELYRDHKVNPMGGCLPMLVQIPVFFALYKALMYSIELRHAPFYLWITDLSAKDPYYITPIIMGATMVIQQKMTPSTMDPMQAKIMMFLPVMFTFMFLNFPSGLVLYWLVNNILTILQQWRINHTLKEA
jgi:YidC/Oxa1 family membrane protein insertase